MLLDILAVLVVTLISSLFVCTTSVHGLPPSRANFHLMPKSSSADGSSSLRLYNHRPVASVDNHSGGDISEMLTGDESDEDDDNSFLSSIDVFNEPSEFVRRPSSSSRLLSRELSFAQNQQKRSPTPPPSPPTRFNFNSAVVTLADAENVNNLNQLNEPIRLSPSLKKLVETNPFARAWLTMLLQKLMKEQSVPYIFKYGRRRK